MSASGSWTSGAARRTGLPQRTRRKASRTSPTGEAELSRRFCGWHEPIAAVLEAADEAAILRNDVYYLGPLPRWSEGRVVLVGDAAHATTPGVGQGPGDRGRRRTRRRARSRRHATGCPRRLRVDPPAADRSRAEPVASTGPRSWRVRSAGGSETPSCAGCPSGLIVASSSRSSATRRGEQDKPDSRPLACAGRLRRRPHRPASRSPSSWLPPRDRGSQAPE